MSDHPTPVSDPLARGRFGRRAAAVVFAILALVVVLAARGGVRFSSDYYDIDPSADPGSALADALLRLDLAPPVDAAELAVAIDAVRARARAGDVEATRFLAAVVERRRDDDAR